MAFTRIEDGTGGTEVVFFSDVYLQFEQTIRQMGQPLVIKGEVEKNGKLLAREVEGVESRLNSRSRGVILKLDETEKEKMAELKKILSQYRGNVPLYFNVKLKSPAKTVCLKSSTFHGVTLSTSFLEHVQKTLGRQKIQLC